MGLLGLSICLFLAALFTQAGVSKLATANQAYYQQVIGSYSIVPDALPNSMLAVLPRVIGATELLLAVLLLIPMVSAIGLGLAAVLLSFYTLILLMQLMEGKAGIDCGCAGPGADTKVSPMLVARNLALLALSISAVYAVSSVGIVFQALAIPLAIMIGLIYLSSDQLIANHQKIQLLNNT